MPFLVTLDARGLLVCQRRGASERVVLVGERPLAQAVKYFERADPITLPFISPESKFDPGNLIGRLKKRFLEGLLLVKCAMILAKPVLPKCENKNCRRGLSPFRDSERSEINCWFQVSGIRSLETGAGPFHCTVCHAKRCIRGFANWLWKVSDLSSDS